MKNDNDKKVYVPMEADIIHPGNLNILSHARELGYVIIGLYTDEAISLYKRTPLLNYEQRCNIVKNLVGVKEVCPQDSIDLTENIKKIKPDYIVHGDDWKTGYFKPIRDRVKDTLNQWGGKLIEPEYTKGISTTEIIDQINYAGTTPDLRRKSLKKLI